MYSTQSFDLIFLVAQRLPLLRLELISQLQQKVRVASGNLCSTETPTEAYSRDKNETTEENQMNLAPEQIANLKSQTIGVGN